MQFVIARSKTLQLTVAVSILLSAALLLCGRAAAVDLTWNPGGAGGGLGTWDTTTTSWDNAGTPQAWNNAAVDTAIFTGTAGTVTLGEAITAAGLQFDTAGYTVTAGTLTLSSSAAVVANADATIESILTGSSSIAKSGNATATLSAETTFSAGGTVSAGTLALTGSNSGTGAWTINSGGTLDLTGGTGLYKGQGFFGIANQAYVTVNAGGTLIADKFNYGVNNNFNELRNNYGQIVLNGGTLQLPTQTFIRAFLVGANGATIDVPTGNTVTKTAGTTGGDNIIRFSANSTLTVTGGGSLTIADALGSYGSTGFSITKTGTGTLNLSGANAYSGATSVSGGSLVVTNTMRNTSGMTVSNGATLSLGATNMFVSGHGVVLADSRVLTADAGTLLMTADMDSRIGNVTLTNGGTWTSNRGTSGFDILFGNTTAGPATVTVSGTGASTMNGTGGIHLQGVQNFAVADVTGDTGADLTVSMILANPGSSGGDAGGINKTGAGTMLLAAANSYAGSTTVTEGTLIVGNGANAGSIGSGAVSVAAGATFTIDRGANGQVWANNFSGSGTLRIEAGQDPQFSGDNSSFTGPVIIDGANAQFRTRSANAWSGQSVVTITNGGMASVFNYTGSDDIKAGSLWGDGTVRLGASDRDLYVGGNDLDATFTGTIINDAGGSGSVIKLGTGTQTLSGNNSYSGGTIVSAGTLVAASANALSSTGTVTLGDANSGANDAAVLIDATGGGITISRAISVANQGTGTFTLGSATGSGSSIAAFSGGITLARDVTLDGGSAGDRLDFSGGISGTGNVTIDGSNRVIFRSAAKTYAGSTTINGVLQLSDGSGTATSLLPNAQPVTVASGGELRLAKGNNSETIGALSGGGTVSNIVGGITSTLIVGDGDGSGTFSGLLSNPSGTLVVEKTGTGTQTFSGVNTYSGSTTINAGTLLAGNAAAFGTTGTITVNAGGTLGVGDGVDFTGRAFTLNAGGKIWLGEGAQVALPDAAALAAWESTNTAGGDGTAASILFGNGATTPSALTSGWTANPDPATYLSDILTLEGTGTGNTYVLSMGYASTFGDMNIWYRPTVNDPFTPLGTSFQGNVAWNSGFTTVGQYGVDPATSTVWAVTDHNSQFVVVPEPGMLALAFATAAAALGFRRRPCRG